MFSRCLKNVIRVTFSNHFRFKRRNNYYFQRISTEYLHWKPYQASHVSHNEINKNENENSMKLPPNYINTSFSQKLNKVYGKPPYTNERNNEKCDEDPQCVMYENIAKDEFISPKDNHISEDDDDENMQSSKKQQYVIDSFNMTPSNTPNKSHATHEFIYSEQNRISNQENNQFSSGEPLNNINDSNKDKKHIFREVNQEENFNDENVNDVEQKTPSNDVNPPDQQIMNQQTNNRFFDTNNTTEIQQGDNEHSDLIKEHEHKLQKKKLMESHADLDESSEPFEVELKHYEQKMLRLYKMDNKNIQQFTSTSEYYLKDNNSDYNKYIMDNNDDESNKKHSSVPVDHDSSSQDDEYDDDRNISKQM